MAGQPPSPPSIRPPQPYRMALPPPPEREFSSRIFAIVLIACVVLGGIIIAVVLNNNPFGSNTTHTNSQTMGTGPQGSTNTPTVASAETPTPMPTPTPTPIPQVVIAINAGGDASGVFVADTDYDTGNQFNDPNASITMTDPHDSASPDIYQSCHWNSEFTYTIPNLAAGASYRVRLHWAELTFEQPGQRVFNVTINDAPVLTGFDVVATAGAWKTALTREFVTTADSDGSIVIDFTQAGPDNPFIGGIEIITI